MNRLIRISFILFLLTAPFLATTSKGASGGMGMGPPAPCGGPFPPCPVPLDSSVWMLLIAGISFGSYKIYKVTKKNPA
ncbi:MAG: hypothetical protein JNL69_11790 [Bacteroidia bacterium]|nr:hypothetical protein [Bacteroidia bacterium]